MAGLSTAKNKRSVPKEKLSFKNFFSFLGGWFIRNKLYFLAFAIPVIIMYIAYAMFKVYPFGEESVLVLDLNGQYVYYFEALRDAFWGEEVFYTTGPETFQEAISELSVTTLQVRLLLL